MSSEERKETKKERETRLRQAWVDKVYPFEIKLCISCKKNLVRSRKTVGTYLCKPCISKQRQNIDSTKDMSEAELDRILKETDDPYTLPKWLQIQNEQQRSNKRDAERIKRISKYGTNKSTG